MASEVHVFNFAVPAGTAIATPAMLPLTMPPRQVTQVDVRVPPGPRGLVGFQLGAAGQGIIPAIPNTWRVTDDEIITLMLENYIDSGGWQAFAYNLGQYIHTLAFTFHCVVPGLAPSAQPSVIDTALLDNTVVDTSTS